MVSSEGLSDMDAMIIFNQIFSIFRVLHDHGFTLQRETNGGRGNCQQIKACEGQGHPRGLGVLLSGQ